MTDQRPAPAAGRGGAPARARPPQRTRSTDPARLAAYTVMRAVADGAYANLELPKVLRGQADRRARRGVRDRAGLRRDADARPLRRRSSPRPPAGRVDQIDDNVLDTLRLGAHQLLGMRVATHAAVDETVGLARMVNGAGASGFVNAVMRRISERDLPTWLDAGRARRGDPIARLAVAAQPPRVGGRGRCGRPCSATARHRRRRSTPSSTPCWRPTTRRRGCPLVARPGLADVDELRRGRRRRARRSRRSAPSLDGGDPGGIPAVRDGRAAVQDEGSQLVALALAAPTSSRAPAASAGSTCAPAPAARRRCSRRWPRRRAPTSSPTRSARTAPTWSARRSAARSTPGIERQGAAPATAGRSARTSPAAYDRVLVDAPCTGLGALRRRPEARWRRTTADVADLGRPAARAAGLGARRHPARRRRRLRHLQPAPRRDPVRRQRRAQAARRRRASSTPGRCSPTRAGAPVAAPRRGPVRPALAARARHRRDVLRPAAQGLTAGAVADAPTMCPCRSHRASCPADFANLERELRRIANADWAHVDVMDNHFVPNLTLGLPVVEALPGQPGAARLPPDDRRPGPLGARGTPRPARQSVTFHVEAAAGRRGRWPRDLRSAGRPGRRWRSSPAPPFAPYADLLPELDMVLVMTVEPGFGGQSFMADQMPKVRAGARGGAPARRRDLGPGRRRRLAPTRSSSAPRPGADVFVAGSAVYGAEDAAAAVDELRALAARHVHAADGAPPTRRTRPASLARAADDARRPLGARCGGHPDAGRRRTVAYWRHVLRGRCNSEPAVTVRDPAAASGRLTWWNSRTDGESPDGRQHARRAPVRHPR